MVALDSLPFSLGEGQAFGFVGPNKTTPMRVVLRVLERNAGQV